MHPIKSLKHVLMQEDKGTSPEGWTSTKKAISIFGIAAGMLYMHQHKLVHCNLKTENILLDDHFYPKVGDLGVAKLGKEGMKHLIGLLGFGTPPFRAPEILRGEPYNNKVDVFSYAIILYEIFTCKLSNEDIARKSHSIWSQCRI